MPRDGVTPQRIGTLYEKMVTEFNKKFMKDYFIHKQQTIPVDYSKVDRKHTPRAVQLPDFVYVKKGSPSLAIECKHSSNDRFPFSSIRPKQHQMLQKFDSFAGFSFVLIGFNGGVKNYLFPYKDYLKFSEIIMSQGRKSFNKDKDKELIKQYSKVVDKQLLKKNYYLDLNIIRYF